jgi:hypothetical protein
MRCRIYYNLSRAVWSIKAMEGEHKGRVIGYADSVLLRNAHTVVSEAGRQRVLREQRKNVHAYIDGQLHEVSGYQERLITPQFGKGYPDDMPRFERLMSHLTFLYYNPYRVSHFMWSLDGGSTEGQNLPLVYLRPDRKVESVPPQQ